MLRRHWQTLVGSGMWHGRQHCSGKAMQGSSTTHPTVAHGSG